MEMKLYKNHEGEVFGYPADGSQDDLMVPNLTPLTFEESDRLENPIKYMSEEQQAIILRQKFPKLTKRKFQLYMLENRLLDDVENAIKSIEDPIQKRRMQIEYESSDDFERLSPAVEYMSDLLGWTDEQVDQMWQQALTL